MSALTITLSTTSTPADGAPAIRKHARYWLDDGSIVVRAQDDYYKVHRTLLHRHSKVLAALGPSTSKTNAEADTYGKADATMVGTENGARTVDGLVVVHIPDALEVKSADFEALLEHLYHDAPLDEDAPFPKVASVLRASAQEQLDFPAIHALARTRLEGMFPAGPDTARFKPEHAEEALTLAVKHDIPSIRKALYYSIATHSHDHDADEPSSGAARSPLSPELSARCNALLEQLIAHFTPILFTVATAGHMACTDVFAEKWMPLVIQRALDENGLCRPLETLEEIIEIDWVKEGLCEECARDKREEWRGEQRDVWARMDDWLS